MLHELLLALLGYTGDLIVDDRERRQSLSVPLPSDTPISDDCTFRLAPDISFLDPSDRDLIERLITLGFYYRELDRFATVSRNLSWIRSANAAAAASPLERCSELAKRKDERPSVYRRAIANGIVEILSVYRSSVLQIEQKLLSETLPILATVTQGLNKFFVLLPPLYELIVKIEREDIRGGQLLNLLHKRCHCGVPELQTCIQRLLWHGHQVMYNQLASWMVYGILQDQHGEFFIRRQEERDVEPAASQTDISKKLAHLSTDDTSLTDWHQGFHIYLDMLPQYIHMHVAESVLFAGKAISVLRNPNTASRFHGAAANSQQTRSPVKIQGFTERYLFSKEMLEDSYVIREELLPQSEADKIESMLRDLKESSEFHKRSFECVVDSIRAISASHLWQLVVVRADLNGHLKALKDYFLLAKGDFFQCFLEESRKLMRLPPRQSTAEADLTVPFQLAASKTTSEEDKYFSKVSLRMPTLGMNVKSSLVDMSKARPSVGGNSGVSPSSVSAGLDGWDGFSLDYAVDWPLQLFFTQDVLSKYLKVFQYLLRLKRAQMELDKSWASVMQQDHTEYSKHLKKELKTKRQYLKPAWRVREHMAFLIRNLQFYIQVDVIESQWNVLQAHVQDCHDFTELVNHHHEQGSTIYKFDDPGRHLSLVLALMRHIVIKMIKPRWCFQHQHKHVCCAERYPTSDGRGRLAYVYAALSVQLIAKKLITRFEPVTRYLSALISQSFLDIGSVSRILDSIMKLCLQFCWTVENQDGSHTSELEQITEEFNKKSNSLYTILRSTRLAGSQRAPFLRRFLLRLNFNSFFEATARGVLNVVRPRPALPVLNQQ